MIKENFIKLYETSFRENWDLPSVSDYGTDQVFFFCDVAEEVARLHIEAYGGCCYSIFFAWPTSNYDGVRGF